MRCLVTNCCRYTGPHAVKVLLQTGHEVLCHDLSFSSADARDEFSSKFAGAHPLKGLTAEESVDEAIQYAGAVDVLFNNHFCPPEMKSMEDTTDEEYESILSILVMEPYRFARAVIPSMKKLTTSRIIFVTSAAPLKPGANVSLYTSARSAANSLVKTLARELGKSGVSVFGIAPNYYASEDTYSQAMLENSEAFRTHVEQQVPLGRLSTDVEMEETILFLATGQSLFLTGQVLSFSGGWV